MKLKRSERLVDMTSFFKDNPNESFPLSTFASKYESAKSSVSEDITILRDIFESQGIGQIKTYPGASGGVEFIPSISEALARSYLKDIVEELSSKDRILPGGYIYLTDTISKPTVLKKFGKIVARDLAGKNLDYVMTVATKGIPLAQAIGYELNVPIVIVRKDSKVTEGTTVSVKYTSESAPRIVQSMEVARSAMEENADVLLVDDFYRGGGTMEGMEALLDIFKSRPVGKYVLCENIQAESKEDPDIKSLTTIEGLDYGSKDLVIKEGNIFQ